MMERMVYDLTKGSGLNFGKGKRVPLCSFVLKGKDPDYYYKTRRALGYVSMPVSSKFKEKVYHDSSSAMLSWNSDISVSDIFKYLLVNMVSTSHLENDEEDTFRSKELVQ